MIAAACNDLYGQLNLKIDQAFKERVENAAKAEGKVLRYIGNIVDGKCKVSIEAVWQRIAPTLHSIKDGENALSYSFSRYYQPLPFVLRGYGAGAAVTAAGVFGDVIKNFILGAITAVMSNFSICTCIYR